MNKNKILFSLLLASIFSFVSLSAQVKESFNIQTTLVSNGYKAIKMNRLVSGHLHITCEINGVMGDFILDSGANSTIIDNASEQKFRIDSEKGDKTAGGAGAVNLKTSQSKGNSINLDGLIISDFTLILMSLDHVNKALSKHGVPRMDGVIGADIFALYNAVIDYKSMCLYLKK